MGYFYSTGAESLQKWTVQRVGTNYLIPENAMKPQYTYAYEMVNKNRGE